MSKLRIVISLPNQNHYQRVQAKAAHDKAVRVGADVQVLYADNEAVIQGQQLLEVLQSRSMPRPDAILAEPLTSTGLFKVAEAAVAAGVGWALLNSQADYIVQLQSAAKAPVFALTRDHTEIGRIQGHQFAALLPQGGTVLYIQGPNTSAAAMERTSGMESVKPANISTRSLRSQWTEASAYETVTTWLRLSTSRPGLIHLVGCQYDGIARGARQAFQEALQAEDRGRWLSLPFTGVDGLADEGQEWVNRGELTATVVTPITTEVAIEKMVNALQSGTQPPTLTLLDPKSYPSLDSLAESGKKLCGRR